MAGNMAQNMTLQYALRTLQVLFAFVVIGTASYSKYKQDFVSSHSVDESVRADRARFWHLAIAGYKGRNVTVEDPYGKITAYQGIPASWCFLVFCGAWTVLGVVYLLFAGNRDGKWIGYSRVVVELVAVLSWFGGFIAVAVNIPSDTCKEADDRCATLAAATAFGALDWLLFAVTSALTIKAVFFNRATRPTTSSSRSSRRSKSAKSGSAIPI